MISDIDRIAFIFGGPVSVPEVGRFVDRYGRRWWTAAQQDAWVRSKNTSLVRAVLNPGTPQELLIGVLLFGFHRRFLRIEHVSVDHNYRRRGVAAAMFARLLAHSPVRQFATISAYAPERCDDGIAWLRAMRFEAISVMPHNGEGGDGEYLFSWSWDKLQKGDDDGDAGATIHVPVGGDDPPPDEPLAGAGMGGEGP